MKTLIGQYVQTGDSIDWNDEYLTESEIKEIEAEILLDIALGTSITIGGDFDELHI